MLIGEDDPEVPSPAAPWLVEAASKRKARERWESKDGSDGRVRRKRSRACARTCDLREGGGKASGALPVMVSEGLTGYRNP